MGITVIAVIALLTASPAIAQIADTNTAAIAALRQSPQNGGARRWQGAPNNVLALMATPSINAHVIQTLPAGAVVTNINCGPRDAAIWCQVRPLHGGPRGYALASTLIPVAGPDGTIATGPNDSARRARRKNFDETAVIPCAQERGQPLGVCNIGAARSGGGDATVAVTFANGFSRLLFFEHGAFIAANPTMSGVGTDTDWQIEQGLHIIRVDDQRYELPVDLVTGR